MESRKKSMKQNNLKKIIIKRIKVKIKIKKNKIRGQINFFYYGLNWKKKQLLQKKKLKEWGSNKKKQ